MTTIKHAPLAVAFVAFVLGCVTKAIVVPPARAGTNPTRWEYRCVKAFNPEEDANKLGAEGWELGSAVGVAPALWCFKRPLP
jgi:hypothetical protein